MTAITNNYPELWSSSKQLQPYYNFITKIKSIVENLLDGDTRRITTFNSWKGPDMCYDRTINGIFIEFKENMYISLWTPFGRVNLYYRDSKDQLLSLIKSIAKVETVTKKINYVTLAKGTENKEVLDPRTVIYQLTPLDNTLSPYEPISHKVYGFVYCLDEYGTYSSIFQYISNGTNDFI